MAIFDLVILKSYRREISLSRERDTLDPAPVFDPRSEKYGAKPRTQGRPNYSPSEPK